MAAVVKVVFTALALMTISAFSTSPGLEIYRAQVAEDLGRYPPGTLTEAGLRARYAGATALDRSQAHGTQVYHLAADGPSIFDILAIRAFWRGSGALRPARRALARCVSAIQALAATR